MKISFEINPDDGDVEKIYSGLAEFNKPKFEKLGVEEFGCFVRDDEGQILGGATGIVAGGTAMVKYLWIADDMRGQGVGTKIFEMMRIRFKDKGVKELHLGTHNFQAPEFYTKMGFEEVSRHYVIEENDMVKIQYIKKL